MRAWSPLGGGGGRTYVYLGRGSVGADHVQLLDGERLLGQLEADVVAIVALLLVQQSDPRFGLWESSGAFDILPSGAITNTMNILILFFPPCRLCSTRSVGAVWVNCFPRCYELRDFECHLVQMERKRNDR